MPNPALFHCPKCGRYFIRNKHLPDPRCYEDTPAKEVLVARTLRGDHIAEWECHRCKGYRAVLR